MARITDADLSAFLQAMCSGHTVTKAAELIGHGRTSLYEIRERDPAFAEKWKKASDVGNDRLEQEAYRRAYEGTESAIYYKGETVATERKFSDTLLLALLRRRNPDVWGKTLKIEADIVIDGAQRILAARARAGFAHIQTIDVTPPEVADDDDLLE